MQNYGLPMAEDIADELYEITLCPEIFVSGIRVLPVLCQILDKV